MMTGIQETGIVWKALWPVIIWKSLLQLVQELEAQIDDPYALPDSAIWKVIYNLKDTFYYKGYILDYQGINKIGAIKTDENEYKKKGGKKKDGVKLFNQKCKFAKTMFTNCNF